MNAWQPAVSLIRLCALLSLSAAGPAAAANFDWYRWRGPDLNGVSKEADWSASWPSAGPKQLWKAFVGTGFSAVSVANGRAYTMGNQSNSDFIYCLDCGTGREIWHHSYAAGLDGRLYEGGPNSTPTIDGHAVYTLGRKGELFCLEADSGKVIWRKDLMKDFGLKEPGRDWWGFTGSPLVEGELLILNAGTHGMALEKKTGRPVWVTGQEATGYASPVPFAFAGKRAVAIFAAKAVVALEVKTGRECWQFPWKTSWDINAADPIVSGDELFVSSGYRTGGALLRFGAGQRTVVWQGQQMHNQLNASVLIDGHLYGVSGQNGHGGDLRCVEWQTGKVKWEEPSIEFGSLMAADGKLIVLSEKGELTIAPASPRRFQALARAQVLGGKCWTVPVLSNGRIYCRNAQGDLVCLDVAGKAAQAAARCGIGGGPVHGPNSRQIFEVFPSERGARNLTCRAPAAGSRSSLCLPLGPVDW